MVVSSCQAVGRWGESDGSRWAIYTCIALSLDLTSGEAVARSPPFLFPFSPANVK